MQKTDSNTTVNDVDSCDSWVESARDALHFQHGASRKPRFSDDTRGRIEHTLLRPDATEEEVEELCRAAIAHGFRGVCCLPRDVRRCRELLDGHPPLVVTVVDFPLGCGSPRAVSAAAARSAEEGAAELDMVVDLRALREGRLDRVRDGIARVVDVAGGRPVKVILETGHLSPAEIVAGSVAAEAAGARFVKTSTGFGPRGACAEDIRLMRRAVENRLGIKAAGGIRNCQQAEQLLAAGADVIGTSNGPGCVTMSAS